MKVTAPAGPNSREFYGCLTQAYSLREQYDFAHSKRKVNLAPHGFFRQLAPGNNCHAREFLYRFGPLKLDAGARIYGHGKHLTVDLEEFWRLHLRFRLIANLWESLHDKSSLIQALLDIQNRRDQAHEDFPLGVELSPPPATTWREYRFPWQLEQQPPTEWLQKADFEQLRTIALYILNLELNIHTLRSRIIWQRGWEPSGERFRPARWVDSLWSAIWESFGMDISGTAWRRCPHCQQLFYPKRRDQYYCSPRQQALASKRDYARRFRAGELKTQKRTSSLGGIVRSKRRRM